MWAVGLIVVALGQCFLFLLLVASCRGDRPESTSPKCNNCTGQNLETVLKGLEQGYRENYEQRQLDIIKTLLENQLNRSFAPTPPTIPPTANPDTSLPAPFSQKAVRNIIRKLRQRYKTTARIHGYEDELSEILSSAEEANSGREDEFVFSLKTNAPPGSDVQVLNANMYVLVRCKKKEKGQMSMRRVKLMVFELRDDNSTLPALATLDVEVRHTRWQKLILPRGFIQKSLNQTEQSVKFRIICQNCTGDIQPILIYKSRKGGNPRKGQKDKARKSNNPEKARKTRKSRKPRRERKRRLHKRRPFIFVATRVKNKINSRSRRSIAPQQCLATVRGCQIRPFYVTFEQMGWDNFVSSPKGFYANYCDGLCPIEEHILSSRPHNASKYHNRPCCMATAADPLTVTYGSHGGQDVTITIPGMKIKQCGCQWL